MAAGRPTKYTPSLQAEIVALIRQGVPRVTTATLVGISRETLNAWENCKPEFSDALLKAEAECEHEHIRRVNSGRLGWQTSAWMLERHAKFRERWSRTVKQEHSGEGGGPLKVTVVYEE